MTKNRTRKSPLLVGLIFVSLIAGLFVNLALPGAVSATQAGDVTAIVGARIWDGTGAAAYNPGMMLIRDGRIMYVGSSGAVPIPAGATVVNLNGRTVIPGLINTHGHVGDVMGLEGGH